MIFFLLQIKVLRTDAELLEDFDADQLPVHLGGTAEYVHPFPCVADAAAEVEPSLRAGMGPLTLHADANEAALVEVVAAAQEAEAVRVGDVGGDDGAAGAARGAADP